MREIEGNERKEESVGRTRVKEKESDKMNWQGKIDR